MVIGRIAPGSSVRLPATQIACVWKELLLVYLSARDCGQVASFVRLAAGLCLQKLREILHSVWKFLDVFDLATVQNTS